MDMVGHKAEGIDLTTQPLLPLGKIVEVIKEIIFTGKNRMPIVATLNDVVGIAGKDDASCSGHGQTLAET